VTHAKPDPVIEKIAGKTYECWDAKHSEELGTPLGMMAISNETTPQMIHESCTDDESFPAESNAGVGFRPRPPVSTQLPGAFAAEGPGGEGDIESVIESDDNPELLEVSAEIVDTEEENRKRQKQVEKEVQEKLEQERTDREKNTAVAEIVTGFWCSPRVRRFSILGIVFVIVLMAVVLGTLLPKVLEPNPPSPVPGISELLFEHTIEKGSSDQTTTTRLTQVGQQANLGRDCACETILGKPQLICRMEMQWNMRLHFSIQ